jgi:hypothetical protein
MTRAHTNQLISTVLALAGIVGACALVAVPEYRYQRSIEASAESFARQRAAYEHCAADMRKSGEHQDLVDLMIDAKCPVKPVEERPRGTASAIREQRGSALRLAGAIVTLCALPWAASRLARIKRG